MCFSRSMLCFRILGAWRFNIKLETRTQVNINPLRGYFIFHNPRIAPRLRTKKKRRKEGENLPFADATCVSFFYHPFVLRHEVDGREEREEKSVMNPKVSAVPPVKRDVFPDRHRG